MIIIYIAQCLRFQATIMNVRAFGQNIGHSERGEKITGPNYHKKEQKGRINHASIVKTNAARNDVLCVRSYGMSDNEFLRANNLKSSYGSLSKPVHGNVGGTP